MLKRFFRFAKEDEGNVTIDWIVLTAGMVTLAFAVMTSVSNGASTLSDETASTISAVEVDGT